MSRNLSGLSIKGVILGGIADVVATNVATVPLLAIAAARANLMALPRAEQTAALATLMHSSPGLQASSMAVGSLCSVLGGYVAARIAGRSEVLNGALSAYLCTAFGIAGLFLPLEMPLWEHLAGFLLAPALGAAGGWLRLWHLRRPVDPSDDLAQYFEAAPGR
jgi:hypothetical protein